MHRLTDVKTTVLLPKGFFSLASNGFPEGESQKSDLQCTTAGPRAGMVVKCCLTWSVKAHRDSESLGTPWSGQEG